MTTPPTAGRRPAPPGGTAPDRTRLAWRRTVLAVTAVGLLTIRFALFRSPGPVGLSVAALCLFGWLALLATTYRRIQAMAHFPPPPVGGVLPMSAAAAAGFALLGVLLVLMPH